ncbi:hypothetical protein M422DRAFT_229571 [Sphaerobolus stellatus SS14]|uniref:AB hydrolase-1 domain-containing protein n=1 Tax=Sphaerobolus stellatus (strain SS14) TaxID=990650 RepID=A0A0C9VIX8_SPHS4|nr:hypothetical protein M422DRAFT_229571 [Sphaerobolus stellatus SS14]
MSVFNEKQGLYAGFGFHNDVESKGTRTRTRWRAKLGMLCAFSLIALGIRQCCSVSGGSGSQRDMVFDWDKVTPSPTLKWLPCAEKRECARFEVPMDYDNPSGDKVAVALTRFKAKVPADSKEYRGPILFNPGGPGGSGIQLVERIGENMQRLLGEEYDIVGFDPRGIGRTTPRVSLFDDDFERAFWEHDALSLVNASTDSLSKEYARSFVTGQLATKKVNHLAQYVGTALVARDMLSITRAHGRDKLQYWGFSYGTLLGATFAAMFPDNVERLIIDGVVEFSDYYEGRWYSNLVDTDKILKYWFDECVAAGPTCPMHDDSSEAIARRVHNVFEGLRVQPLSVYNGSAYGVLEFGPVKRYLFQLLYKPFAGLPPFTKAFAALEAGDGAPMLSLLQSGEFVPKCKKDPLIDIPVAEAGYAVRCGEGQGVQRDISAISKHLEELSRLSVFADVWTAIGRISCVGWDIVSKERYGGSFNTTTSFPLLIIGNTADPVTPLFAAKKAAAGFRNSALLTVNTPGHCSLSGTSPSASKYIRNYFRDGSLPPEGTVCEVEDQLFGPKKDLVTGLSLEDQEIVEAARAISAEAQVGLFF